MPNINCITQFQLIHKLCSSEFQISKTLKMEYSYIKNLIKILYFKIYLQIILFNHLITSACHFLKRLTTLRIRRKNVLFIYKRQLLKKRRVLHGIFKRNTGKPVLHRGVIDLQILSK